MGKKREGKGSSNKRSARRGEESDEEFEAQLNLSAVQDSEGEEELGNRMASPVKTSSAAAPSTPIPSTPTASTFDMSEAMEMLREKRINLREPGLQNIIKYLQSSRSTDEVNPLDSFQDTLISILLRMIRKPASTKEGSLVCQLLNLMALHFGADNVTFVEQFDKPLQQCVDGKGPEFEALRTDALFTLTFITFTCGNEEYLQKMVEYLITLLDFESLEGSGVVHYTPLVKAKALECLTLLSTMLTPSDVLERVRDGNLMEIVQELLEADSNDIVSIVSAGKSMAFFYEVALNFIEEAGNGSEPAYVLSDNPRVVGEIMDAISRIAKDSCKRVSKKNRKEQRAEFRDVIDFFSEGELETEVIHMQGADVDIETFSMRVIVDALREVLSGGFHSSLRLYPVVKDMLGVEFVTDDMDGGGSTMKVTKGSSQDKRRSTDRKQDRRSRDAFTEYGEDYDD